MKNSNDTTGNRTRNLFADSAMPQPTLPPRTGETTSLIFALIYLINYKKLTKESRHTRENILKVNSKNQGCSVWNGQIAQVLGCFEHGNEQANYI
jgi:hypothetical protein